MPTRTQLPARAKLLEVPSSMRQHGDYGASSFFGSLESDPSTDYAPLVLAATADPGAARAVYDSWFETMRLALRPGLIDRRTYDILKQASR